MTVPIATKAPETGEPPPSLGKGKATQDRLLRLPQILQHYLPVSRSTFYNLVKNGEIDPPIKITERASCWWESGILAYIAKQEARS